MTFVRPKATGNVRSYVHVRVDARRDPFAERSGYDMVSSGSAILLDQDVCVVFLGQPNGLEEHANFLSRTIWFEGLS